MESRIRVVRPIFLEPLEMPSRSASRSMLESLAIACLLDPIFNSAATWMVSRAEAPECPTLMGAAGVVSPGELDDTPNWGSVSGQHGASAFNRGSPARAAWKSGDGSGANPSTCSGPDHLATYCRASGLSS